MGLRWRHTLASDTPFSEPRIAAIASCLCALAATARVAAAAGAKATAHFFWERGNRAQHLAQCIVLLLLGVTERSRLGGELEISNAAVLGRLRLAALETVEAILSCQMSSGEAQNTWGTWLLSKNMEYPSFKNAKGIECGVSAVLWSYVGSVSWEVEYASWCCRNLVLCNPLVVVSSGSAARASIRRWQCIPVVVRNWNIGNLACWDLVALWMKVIFMLCFCSCLGAFGSMTSWYWLASRAQRLGVACARGFGQGSSENAGHPISASTCHPGEMLEAGGVPCRAASQS